MKPRAWAGAALTVLIIIVAVLILAPIQAPQWRAEVYVVVLGLMALELVLIGMAINNKPAGAFIDNRNRLSLSKLQAGAWTVIVLGGFATAAAYNAAVAGAGVHTVTALSIQIPGELLLAMGISATSLVATPALLSIKATEQPAAGAVASATRKLGADVSANGKLLLRGAPDDASWKDLVTGDEVGNAASPDLGKIQQATITLVLLGCYAAYVFLALGPGGPAAITTLPGIDKSFVWLLGISHASYLAYKAAPHTESAGQP